MSKTFEVSYSGQLSANCDGTLVAFLDKRNIYVSNYDFSKVPVRIIFSRRSPLMPRVQFSPHEPSLLANTFQGYIKLWDCSVDTRKSLWHRHDSHDHITDLGWCRCDTNLFATCSQQTNTLIWDRRQKKTPSLHFPVTVMKPLRIRWHPTKTEIACCYGTTGVSPVYVWDLRKQHEAASVFMPHSKITTDIDWDPDNSNLLATCSLDGRVKVWDVTKQQAGERRAKATGKPLRFVRYTPFGGGIVVIYQNESSIPMLVPSQAAHSNELLRVQTWKGHTKRIVSVDFRPESDDTYHLLTLSLDGSFRMWNFDRQFMEQVWTPRRSRATLVRSPSMMATPQSMSRSKRRGTTPATIARSASMSAMDMAQGLQRDLSEDMALGVDFGDLDDVDKSGRLPSFDGAGADGRMSPFRFGPFVEEEEGEEGPPLDFQEEVASIMSKFVNVEVVEQRGGIATFRFNSAVFGVVDVMIRCPHHYPKAPLNFHVQMHQNNQTLTLAKSALVKEINEIARRRSSEGTSCVKEVVQVVATKLDCASSIAEKRVKTTMPSPPTCFASFSPSGHLLFCNTLSRTQKLLVDSSIVLHYHELRNVLLSQAEDAYEEGELDDLDDDLMTSAYDQVLVEEEEEGDDGRVLSMSGTGESGDDDEGVAIGAGSLTPRIRRRRYEATTPERSSPSSVRDSTSLLAPGFSPRVWVHNVRALSVSFEMAQKLRVEGELSVVCRRNREVCLESGNYALYSMWNVLDSLVKALKNRVPLLRRRIANILRLYERERDVQTLAVLTSVIPKQLLPEGAGLRHEQYKRFYGKILEYWGLYCQRNEIVKDIKASLAKSDSFRSCYEVDGTVKCSLCRLPVRGLCILCQKCSHGGHVRHIEEWFHESLHCPMCRCQCGTVLVPVRRTD